jgi:iron complex transport system ATP-binding protein
MCTGEHWVILGANGSGKTSLLSALTGYVTPSAGEIELLGESYGQSDWRELRNKIGIVSASISHLMHDEDTALEIVAGGIFSMIGVWGRIPRSAYEAARKWLALCEVSYLAKREWLVLSQGERQRVLIARAMMTSPQLLLLDEPCAGLDPVAREHFLQFLQRLGTSRKTPGLILVTHHVEEIVPCFNHALLLREGHILAQGAASDVLRQDLLAKTFASDLRLTRREGRYNLNVIPAPKTRRLAV